MEQFKTPIKLNIPEKHLERTSPFVMCGCYSEMLLIPNNIFMEHTLAFICRTFRV